MHIAGSWGVHEKRVLEYGMFDVDQWHRRERAFREREHCFVWFVSKFLEFGWRVFSFDSA
jgi:hypothetical protein